MSPVTHADSSSGIGRTFSYVCEFVCLCLSIHSLKGKWLDPEVERPKDKVKRLSNANCVYSSWHDWHGSACRSDCTFYYFAVILNIISASLSISIASRALMVQNIRLPRLSVHKSELWQNG